MFNAGEVGLMRDIGIDVPKMMDNWIKKVRCFMLESR